MAVTAEELRILVTAEVDSAIKNLKKVSNSSGSTSKSFLDMAKKIAGPAAAGLIIHKIIEIGDHFSKLAATAEETDNKFGVVFGNTANEVKAWADKYSESVGRSATDTKSFLASMGDLLTPLGFNKDAVDGLSKKVVVLANDLGSFDNMDTADVMRDIQSAMVGNYEVTKKYGVVLNETVIKQEALKEKLWDGKGAIDAQAKAAVALTLIERGNKAAQGDLLRTQNSATNVTRRLESAQKDLGIAIGKNINDGITPMKAITASLIEKYAQWLNKSHDVKKVMNDLGDGGKTASVDIEVLNGAIAKYNEQIKISKLHYNDMMATAMTASKASKNAIKEHFDAEIAGYQRSIDAAQAQIDAVTTLAAAKTRSAALNEKYAKTKSQFDKKAVADAKKAEQVAADTLARQKIQNAMLEKFAQIDQQVAGGLIDGNGALEKENVLRDTEISLIEKGFNVQHSGIQRIIAAAKAEGVVLKDNGKVLKDSLKGLKTQADFAKEYWQTDEQWLADYYAKQKAAEEKALQDFKKAWNDRLSIVSDVTSKVLSILDQLSANEIQGVTNTNDAIIKSITDAGDAKITAAKANILESGALSEDEKNNIISLQDEEAAAMLGKTKEQQVAIKAYYEDKINEAENSTAYIKGLSIEEANAVKKAEDDKAAALKTAKEKQWKMDKAFAVAKSIIDTISAVVEAAPNAYMMAAVGVLGAAETAAIAAKPMPSFAKGGEFITDGPQAIMVGDNPGGREKVTITPESSANINGPTKDAPRIIINLDGKNIADFMTEGFRNGDIEVYEGALVS